MFAERKPDKLTIILICTNILSLAVTVYLFLFPKSDVRQLNEDEIIMVQIAGEIKNPDVYELKRGARLYELVELAGGFTEEADQMSVNLAQKLEDEDQIIVLNIDNLHDGIKKVNINTADAEELMTLKGIGEVRANEIIYFRNVNGPFTSIEEIKLVTGIGDATYENIKDYICV